MTYHELDTIVLTRDLPEYALRTGTLGVVVHLHSATVAEVEFIQETGARPLVTALQTDVMRPAQPGDLQKPRAAT